MCDCQDKKKDCSESCELLCEKTHAVVDNYIGGKFVEPKKGEYMDVHNPSTEEKIGKVAMSTAEDVDTAVANAAEAFKEWSKWTTKQRAGVLFRFHELVRKNRQFVAEILNLENGKNMAEALGSVDKSNETVEFASGGPWILAGRKTYVSSNVSCEDRHEPIGVVGHICPYNFPFMVPLWVIPMAIMCGNTIVLKPSEKVPMCAHYMMKLFKMAGLPDGVVNMVNGAKEVVERLCDNPDVKLVTFVGSTKVARIVTQRCHKNEKRVLALGGAKNHLVVMPDCNIPLTSDDVVKSFTGNTGQRCMAASVLVMITDQKDLLSEVARKAAMIKPGTDASCIGPAIDEESRQKILRYIEMAVKDGNELVLDGRNWQKDHKPGFWIGPTIIKFKKDQHSHPALIEEIFGPVLSVAVVDTPEEAIEMENSNPYGNAACIYTTNGLSAEFFINRFQAGMTGVNVGVPVPREPFSFGGWNDSNMGHHDITGTSPIDLFTRTKKVTTKWYRVPEKERTWTN